MAQDSFQTKDTALEHEAALPREPRAAAAGEGPKLIAYRLQPDAVKLVSAPTTRAWMDATTKGWAYRCLPLNMANQAGWLILNARDVEVTWNGNARQEGLRIRFLDGPPSPAIASMFGYGIVTWKIPYLFRTPPGFNLLVRGPTNTFKEAASPLDGIVETDWSVSSFTMNWKITIPFWKVRFEKDEPIAMILPLRRHDVESFQPEILNLESNPELEKSYHTWAASRHAFTEENFGKFDAAGNPVWQKHYTKGIGPAGETAPEHQVKFAVRAFEEKEPPALPSEGKPVMRSDTPAALAHANPSSGGSPVTRFKRWARFMLDSLQRWTY